MKRKIFSVLFALVLALSLSLITAVPVAAADPAVPDRIEAIILTADRLVALQGTDGGWDWDVTDFTEHSGTIPSAFNLYGVTALGLIDAYQETGDTAYYDAAQLTADHLKTLSRATDSNVRFQTFDYRFLVEFSALSGDPSYEAHALSEWNWVKTNVASFYADTPESQETIYTFWYTSGGNSHGFAFWQAADCGLATLAMGDTSYASNMAAVLAGHLTDIDPGDIYRFIGGGHALEFLNEVDPDPETYSTEIDNLTNALIATQEIDGSWGTGQNPEGYAQDVAYAIMGLAAVSEDSAAQAGADWLVTNQGYDSIEGGWNNSTDNKEYSETDSEALQALVATEAPVTIGTDGYYSIQSAIDAASAGDTIIANDGTYTEHLIVNKANLTIKSASGNAAIVLQAVDNQGMKIAGAADGFTLGGEEGHGFTITGDGARLIELENGPSGVEISYNSIDSSGPPSMGISVGAADVTGLTISFNDFTADSEGNDGSIAAWHGGATSDVTVDENTFTAPTGSPGSYAIQFSGITESTISGNTITGYTGAGAIVITNGSVTSKLFITGNEVSECSYGVRFEEECVGGTPGVMSTVTVTQNTIRNNRTGLKIAASIYILASDFVIEYNNFVETQITYFGLQNDDTELVTAENNWWGSATGPAHASNPLGTGDSVSDNVDFTPWLLSEGGEPVATYTDYITVPDGWSLISPNVAWADWEALGSNLVLTYDTSIPEPAFAEPQSYSSLSPLSAIYIKTSGGGLLGMNYPATDLGMYTSDLVSGWNLIGIPETNATPGAILSPIRLGVNNEVALATLASQGDYNPSGLTFYQSMLDTTECNVVDLDPFDGYWAYMNVPKEFGVIVVPEGPG